MIYVFSTKQNTTNNDARFIRVRLSSNPERIVRGSRGISDEYAQAVAGRWILCRYLADEANGDRLAPCGCSRLPKVGCGTINAHSSCVVDQGSTFCTDANSYALCFICGCKSDNTRLRRCPQCEPAPTPTPVTCRYCGNVIDNPTRTERKYRAHLSCREAYVHTRRSYHDWHDAPRFSAPNKRDIIAHLGYELEMHAPRGGVYADSPRLVGGLISRAANVDVYKPYMHIEADGSLYNYGEECISEPMTLAAHKAALQHARDGIKAAKDAGCWIDNRCGLHVHIDRQYFGNAHRRADVCLARLTEVNYVALFDAIDRRQGNSSYCAKVGLRASDDIIDTYEKTKARASGHSMAINAAGSNTIEYRRLAAVDNADDLLALLDIVNALARIIKAYGTRRIERATYRDLGRRIAYASTIEYIKAHAPSDVWAAINAGYTSAHHVAAKRGE